MAKPPGEHTTLGGFCFKRVGERMLGMKGETVLFQCH